jgi:hypothetical protein
MNALLLILAILASIALGWCTQAWVTEERHDCMPHDPDYCRRDP